MLVREDAITGWIAASRFVWPMSVKDQRRNDLRGCDGTCRPETIHTLSADTSKVARAIICALRFALV